MHITLKFWFTGDQPGADLGPLISPDAKKRVCELVQSGVDEGANVSAAVLYGWQLSNYVANFL